MALANRWVRLSLAAKNAIFAPMESLRQLAGIEEKRRGHALARDGSADRRNVVSAGDSERDRDNPLKTYFDQVKEGPGVWKWLHYFEAYHHHLQRFIGRDITLVEIGVYSGGSLDMWKKYFGAGCRIHGVDIEESCRCYDDDVTKIHIGDQEDRAFWRKFKQEVPMVDVLIDDGGHTPEQQMVTLEEMLPRIRPGGVYICEDIHGVSNRFSAFVHSLADELNASQRVPHENGLEADPTPFQSAIHSIHVYPYMVVIEKRDGKFRLVAPKHGTQWQPFRLSDSDPRYRKQPIELAK